VLFASVLFGLALLHHHANRLARNNVSELTYFVPVCVGGRQNHTLRIQYVDIQNSVKFMNFTIFFKFSKIQQNSVPHCQGVHRLDLTTSAEVPSNFPAVVSPVVINVSFCPIGLFSWQPPPRDGIFTARTVTTGICRCIIRRFAADYTRSR